MKNGAVQTDPGITEPCRREGTWSRSNACSELLPLDQGAEELVQLTTGTSQDAGPTSSSV